MSFELRRGEAAFVQDDLGHSGPHRWQGLRIDSWHVACRDCLHAERTRYVAKCMRRRVLKLWSPGARRAVSL